MFIVFIYEENYCLFSIYTFFLSENLNSSSVHIFIEPFCIQEKFLVPKTQIRKIYCSSTIITSKYVAFLKLIRNVHMQIR